MLMSHLFSVIVCDLDVVGIPIDEAEADPPLIIDGNGDLPIAVAPKLVEPITARHSQIVQARCQVDVL